MIDKRYPAKKEKTEYTGFQDAFREKRINETIENLKGLMMSPDTIKGKQTLKDAIELLKGCKK